MSEQLTTATTYPVSQGCHQSLIEQHCTAIMTWHRCKSFRVSCLRSACCFACGSSKTYRQCTALCCSLVLRRASALGLCTYAGQSCLYSGFYASDRGKMLPKPVAGVTSGECERGRHAALCMGIVADLHWHSLTLPILFLVVAHEKRKHSFNADTPCLTRAVLELTPNQPLIGWKRCSGTFIRA